MPASPVADLEKNNQPSVRHRNPGALEYDFIMPRLTRPGLEPAVRAGIVSAEQADRLAEFFGASTASEQPRFSFVHVLYYLGGMIAIGAMSLFMTLGWNALGGYLGHLSYRVFKDSPVFPFALSLSGLAIIRLGVIWQRREAEFSVKSRGCLPQELRELVGARE
jgi:hypothetical protein